MIPWHWGIPWHWVIPRHWVIPITDTPKRIPITLSDTDTLSDFSSHWQFWQPTQEFTHYTEGPCFPHKQTGHWVIPMTLRDTPWHWGIPPDSEWYPLPWVRANRILDGWTHTIYTKKNPTYKLDVMFLPYWVFYVDGQAQLYFICWSSSLRSAISWAFCLCSSSTAAT